MKQSQDSFGWSAMLRAVFSHSSDDIATGDDPAVDENDTSGFNFNDVDLAFWGAMGPYRWRVSADIDDNDAGVAAGGGSGFTGIGIEDAYVSWTCGEYFDATMGQFKPQLTRSNSVDPEKQVMIDRTVLGSALDFWDDGIGLSGALDYLNWYVGLLDGFNGHEKNHLYYARGEYHLGSGAGEYEGAMGSSDQLNATVGVTFLHNDTDPAPGSSGDQTSYIADFNGNVSNFGFGAEIARLDDDSFLATSEDYSNITDGGALGAPFDSFLLLSDDSTPWSVTGSYLLNPEWELVARYEDLDNDNGGAGADNTVLSVGANWYKGDAGRWQAQFSMIDADTGFNDGDILEVGYAIGATR
jgi:hypothetical protein